MTERWYEILNMSGIPIAHWGKPVLFRHAAFGTCEDRNSYSAEEVEEMAGNSSFKNGWMEKKEYYLVNMDGMGTKLLFEYVNSKE